MEPAALSRQPSAVGSSAAPGDDMRMEPTALSRQPSAVESSAPAPGDDMVRTTEQGGGAVKLDFAGGDEAAVTRAPSSAELEDPGPPSNTLCKKPPPRQGGASQPNPRAVSERDALLSSKTPLIRAVETCDTALVMEALARAEDPAATDLHGNNALHYAAADIKTAPETITALAKAGVDVNAQVAKGGAMGEARISKGFTPLHVAAANGCASNAAALVAAGADVCARNETTDEQCNGQTPLHAMLYRANACCGFEHEVGRAREDVEALAKTLCAAAQIRDAKGRTLLELAIESRDYLITMFDRNQDRRFGGASGRVTHYKRLEGAIVFLGGDRNPA